jgi:hypothetical protein
MLLKFTTPDMLNSQLVDATTGETAFTIVTTLDPSSSSASSSASSVSLSQKMHLSEESRSKIKRNTHITDTSGTILVDICWTGRRPCITIGNQKVGGLSELFDTAYTNISFVLSLLVGR